MSNKLDDDILTKIMRSFQDCEKQCKYHKQFKELENKDEVFKALQVILKVLIYHETEDNKLPAGTRADILMLLNMFSTQYSAFDILKWYTNAVLEIEKSKKWIN